MRRHCATALGTPVLSSPTRLARACRAAGGVRASAHLREGTVHRLGGTHPPCCSHLCPCTCSRTKVVLHQTRMYSVCCSRAVLSARRALVNADALRSVTLRPKVRSVSLRLCRPPSHLKGPPACAPGSWRGELGVQWALFVPDWSRRVGSEHVKPCALRVWVSRLLPAFYSPAPDVC